MQSLVLFLWQKPYIWLKHAGGTRVEPQDSAPQRHWCGYKGHSPAGTWEGKG